MEDVETLTIEVKGRRIWDEVNEEFITIPAGKLILKHNLISISKWEAKHKKAYMKKRIAGISDELTPEEALDYIKIMTINDVPDEIYYGLSESDLQRIKVYIDDPMTATKFAENQLQDSQKGQLFGDVMTAELVYYWMLSYQLPEKCEEWHFNRLITLIKLCSVKSEKPKKMSAAEIAARNKALNEQRKAKYKSRG